jgi:uncharacterized membrane protein
MILGVIGPVQLIIILVIIFVIALPIVLLVSRAKHKERANTLDSMLRNQHSQSEDKFEKLERLNKLRTSGALTEEEYEREKRKIFG